MDEATELAHYLPLSFKTPKEREYIEFLWEPRAEGYRDLSRLRCRDACRPSGRRRHAGVACGPR